MENNNIVQSLWIGGELSKLEQLCINSFLKNGHEFHLYTYDDVKNVPLGAKLYDANEIVPKDNIFVINAGWGKGSYAGGFSDYFRYELLNKNGGWWVDTDIVCLNYFNFYSNIVFASSFEGKYGQLANGCVMKLQRNSIVTKHLYSVAKNKDFENLNYAELGPHLVQKTVKDMNLENFVLNYDVFCPITWRAVEDKIVFNEDSHNFKRLTSELKDFLRPVLKPNTKKGRITKNSYAVHLWNEIWRQNNIDKNATYHKKCLFEKLKSKYL